MKITVCWKWVAIDGDTTDERWAGVSPADEAALETALQLAGPDDTVVVVTVGPAASESGLRRAVASGATHAVRIDTATASSRDAAAAIAELATGSDYVLCGDYSLDRGTGSVPAFIAAELAAAQALGLVDIDLTTRPLRTVRRLDGGRREILTVPTPAVLSVEGSVAKLRRASLAASLRAKTATIEIVPGPPSALDDSVVSTYRPRARTLTAPTGDTLARMRGILDIGGGNTAHADSVALDPPQAAARIIEQLREWGYLD